MGRWVAQVTNEDPERCQRVLNNKTRMIGVDKDALSSQVDERKSRDEQDRLREEEHAKLSNFFAEHLAIQQQDAASRSRNSLVLQDTFRKESQLKHTTREWDLNRPDSKKRDVPARIGDDDPRCGPSSLQKFDGEDLSAAAREKAQMDQCKTWWDTQSAEHEAIKQAQKESDAAYAAWIRYLDEVQRGVHAHETTARRELMRRQLEENLRLADEKLAKKQAVQQLELHSNQSELEFTTNSPFMTEDPAVAQSVLSPYRVRKDHWKGMSEPQRRAILDVQLKQVQEVRLRKQAQAAEEAAEARYQNDVLNMLDKQHLEVENFKKSQAAKAANFLKSQMMEKSQRDKGLDGLYRNRIDPVYFSQFGTSHR